MYVPEQFREPRDEVHQELIRRHPLAVLIANVDGALNAEHLPLQLHVDPAGSWRLCGHLARSNPLWRRLPPGSPVLAVFHGAEHYISPSAYPSKAEHGRVVPTWNYGAVHLDGTIRFVEDAAWLRGLVESLTDAQEGERTPRWRVTDAPAPFTAEMLKAIVGVQIAVTRVTGKLKASQNRSAADRAGVRAALSAQGVGPEALEQLVRDPRS